MSRFDSNFDDMEEKYIYEKIDDDDNNIIENIINENFNLKKFSKEIEKENENYFNFLINNNNDSINNINENGLFDNIKNLMFQNCKNLEEQIEFMINYLKYEYGVIDAKNLKQFFKEFTNEEDFIPLKELEKLILKNFNKSTINLKNIDEEKKTFKLLIEIMQ
jgi:hypothetical protein